jgi:hypothetical protein
MPDWVPLARAVHLCGMAVGAALLVGLLDSLYAAGLCRRYPAFTAYLSIAICRAAQGFWGVAGVWYMWSEGATMAVKALAVLEAFVVLFPRPRVPTLVLLTGLAAILAGITLLLPAEPNPVREFERYRAAAHVGLAAFTAAGCGWLWRRPRDVNPYVRAYWRIWTFRLVCMAALGFLNYQAAPADGARWVGYYVWAGGFLASSYAASLMWIRWTRFYGPPVVGGSFGGSSAGLG